MEGSAVSTLPVAQPELTTAAHQSVMATPPSSAGYTSYQGTGIAISLTLICIFTVCSYEQNCVIQADETRVFMSIV